MLVEGRFWWVVQDGDAVIALLTGCRRERHAQRIACAFFPEARAVTVRDWAYAGEQRRAMARQAFHITPQTCLRRNVDPPPNPLPAPPSLEQQAARLRRHFARVGGAR